MKTTNLLVQEYIYIDFVLMINPFILKKSYFNGIMTYNLSNG